MAIIRNERANRQDRTPSVPSAPEEEEIDYRWHPTEEEFSSPLAPEQWAELLGDATFMESDPAKAVRCLRDYGEPATFQQLSIRYRGTMGRYRRWLSEAAQSAGERFGVPAPQKDQFGMDEWWPLLYVIRATGKPGAGVYEMQLRPEVEEAFLLIDEQEKQAKRAENARQLQRIEQLERARREERERRAAEAAKEAEEARLARAAQAEALAAIEAAAAEEEEAAAQAEPSDVDEMGVRTVAEVLGVEAPKRVVATEPAEEFVPAFPALNEFLSCMADKSTAGGSRYVAGGSEVEPVPFDATGPLDYALRYAERLRTALARMREASPRVTAAAVARAMGDETVERVQSILNGQEIPAFSYVDALRDRLFVNPEYLEASDDMEDAVPVYCTYQEVLESRGEQADLRGEELPSEIAYVVDDSKDRRTGVILRFSALRCALLMRAPVRAEAKRSESVELDAFVRMVDELDAFARAQGVERTSRTVSAQDWDKLAAGAIWPGTLL